MLIFLRLFSFVRYFFLLFWPSLNSHHEKFICGRSLAYTGNKRRSSEPSIGDADYADVTDKDKRERTEGKRASTGVPQSGRLGIFVSFACLSLPAAAGEGLRSCLLLKTEAIRRTPVSTSLRASSAAPLLICVISAIRGERLLLVFAERCKEGSLRSE
jgi:hypothetical protein